MFSLKTIVNLAGSIGGMVKRVASVGRVIGGLMTLAGLGGPVAAVLAWGVAEGVSITLAIGLFLVALSLQSQIDSKTAIEFDYELTWVPLDDGHGIARLIVTNRGPRGTFLAKGDMPWALTGPFELPWSYEGLAEADIPHDGQSFVNVASFSPEMFRPYDIGKENGHDRFHVPRPLNPDERREIIVRLFACSLDSKEGPKETSREIEIAFVLRDGKIFVSDSERATA